MAKQRSPCLTRFLSDFTLGFSDGLTVPFALTAGLSSLGHADTVIYAGLAELCAGSISMGIGGYLSAVDELPSSNDGREADGDVEELKGMLRSGGARGSSSGSSRDSVDEDEKDGGLDQESSEDLVRSVLEPLALSSSTISDIMADLRTRPAGVRGAAYRVQRQQQLQRDAPMIGAVSEPLPIWPVASGLSISLGYVIGGIIPLLPYFFATTVGMGLRWSIALCLMALMAFGSGKSWLLRGDERSVKRALWEGLQMLVLGSLAAGAAVLCVHLVGGSEAPV